MNTKKAKINKATDLANLLVAVILAVVIVAAAGFAISDVESAAGDRGKQLLEDSLYRGAVSCYSIEGIYPPTLTYLTENYGTVIDHENYAVFYEIFADNMMPDITVVTLN